jgi:hypothetical protein
MVILQQDRQMLMHELEKYKEDNQKVLKFKLKIFIFSQVERSIDTIHTNYRTT